MEKQQEKTEPVPSVPPVQPARIVDDDDGDHHCGFYFKHAEIVRVRGGDST